MSIRWRLILRLLGLRRRPPAARRGRRPRGRHVEDFVQLLEGHPGTRITTIQLLGGQATQDNILQTKEHIETVDDDGNARQIEAYVTCTCHFNHLLSQENRAVSVCEIGGEVMCSSEGCTGHCRECGSACCARHRTTYDLGNGKTATYCDRHKWLHLWRLWWGLYQ